MMFRDSVVRFSIVIMKVILFAYKHLPCTVFKRCERLCKVDTAR